MRLQRGLDDTALHAATSPVHESDLDQTGGRSGGDVLVHDGSDVSWGKRVQVDLGFDRHPVSQGHHFRSWSCEAVTTVLMPPRAVKSPTTVMRRGSRSVTRSSRI